MTTVRRIRIALAAAAVLCSTPALAQKSTQAQAPQKTIQEKPQVINIGEDETVEGGTIGPDGTSVTSVRRLRLPSTLRLRANFVDEMIKAAEGI